MPRPYKSLAALELPFVRIDAHDIGVAETNEMAKRRNRRTIAGTHRSLRGTVMFCNQGGAFAEVWAGG